MNKNNILDNLVIIAATLISIGTIAACTFAGCTTTQLTQNSDSTSEISKDLSYFTDTGPNDSGEIRNSDVAYTLQILLLDAAGETTEILMLKPDAEIKETK